MKKSISLIIAVALIATMTVGLGVTAAAAPTYSLIYANDAIPGTVVKSINDSNKPQRQNFMNSVGVPDAGTASGVANDGYNNLIFGAAYRNQVEYFFGETFYNNPDGSDLQFTEATLGGWHPEALAITLVGAKDTDGAELGNVFIGFVMNNVGNMLYENADKAGSNSKYQPAADFKAFVDGAGLQLADQYINYNEFDSADVCTINVNFPANIESAESLIVADASSLFNPLAPNAFLVAPNKQFSIEYQGATKKYWIMYKPWAVTADGANKGFNKDGFDIDSIGAYAARIYEYPVDAYKFDDVNEDGIWDLDEFGLEGVEFTLFDSTGTDVIATATSDADGYVNLGNAEAGTYILKETCPDGWHATNYPDGLTVTITDAGLVSFNDGTNDFDAAEFGNAVDQDPITAVIVSNQDYVSNTGNNSAIESIFGTNDSGEAFSDTVVNSFIGPAYTAGSWEARWSEQANWAALTAINDNGLAPVTVWNAPMAKAPNSGEVVKITNSFEVGSFDDATDFYICGDNGFMLFINDKYVGQSATIFNSFGAAGDALNEVVVMEKFGALKEAEGQVAHDNWNQVYNFDIKPYLNANAVNTFTIYAYNTAEEVDFTGTEYNIENNLNPAGVAFACEIK